MRRVKRTAILAVWSSPGFILAAFIYTASGGPLEKVRSQTRALAGANESLRSDVKRLRESPDLAKARDEAAALRERLKAADDKLAEIGTIEQQLAVAESAGKTSESRLNDATKQLNDASIELGKLRAQAAAGASKPPDNERGSHAPPLTQAAPSPALNVCELEMVGKWHLDESDLERETVKLLARTSSRPEADPRIQRLAHNATRDYLSQSMTFIEIMNDGSFFVGGHVNGVPLEARGTWSCSNNGVSFVYPYPMVFERPYVLMPWRGLPFRYKKEGT